MCAWEFGNVAILRIGGDRHHYPTISNERHQMRATYGGKEVNMVCHMLENHKK